VGVVKEHRQCTVARSGLELEIGGSFGRGVCAKSVAHIVRAAVSDICFLEGLLPTLLDVDSTEGRFTGKNQWLLKIAVLMEVLKFSDDWIAKGDASRTTVFAFLDVSDPVLEIDVSPFKIENFTLPCAGGEGEQDDAVEIG